MKTASIKAQWEAFMLRHTSLFTTPEQDWKDNLDTVETFIGKHKRLPSSKTDKKDPSIKTLGSWIGHQKANYHTDIGQCKQIMKTASIKAQWEAFMLRHPSLFKKQLSHQNANITLTISPHQPRCNHRWAYQKEDDTCIYQKCELCGRKTKKSRVGKSHTYVEPNPEKKNEINGWLGEYASYKEGVAVILDSWGMKTTRELQRRFSTRDIIIPEYNEDVYEENKNNEDYGVCMRRGDYVDILKKENPSRLSLLYADFMGQYKTFVKPLLEYLE